MRGRYNKFEAKVAAPYLNDRNSLLGWASVTAILLTTMNTLPAFAVLPVIASVAMASALLTAVAARWSESASDRVLLTDLAGACALVGAAAGILSRPVQVVETVASLAR